jgi:hypothetical protein
MGLSQDRGANKGEHIYHPSVISAPGTIGGVQSSQHQIILSQQ